MAGSPWSCCVSDLSTLGLRQFLTYSSDISTLALVPLEVSIRRAQLQEADSSVLAGQSLQFVKQFSLWLHFCYRSKKNFWFYPFFFISLLLVKIMCPLSRFLHARPETGSPSARLCERQNVCTNKKWPDRMNVSDHLFLACHSHHGSAALIDHKNDE